MVVQMNYQKLNNKQMEMIHHLHRLIVNKNQVLFDMYMMELNQQYNIYRQILVIHQHYIVEIK